MPEISTLGSPGKRTIFSYKGSGEIGVTLEYKDSTEVKVSARLFKMIRSVFSGKTVKGGFSMTDPTKGGLGEWVRDNSARYNTPTLTPRHACHIAAILVHEGYADSYFEGNAITIQFPPLPEGQRFDMNKVYIPAKSAEDWRLFLADPDKQWKTGYSAKTIAYCWQEADGFPACVRKAFNNSGSATFKHIEPLLIIPEHKVNLPGGSAASQNDIFVLAKSGDQLVTIAVEGKVDEPFDKPVSEWYQSPSAGKVKRLEFLCSELNLPVDAVMDIPYQLLHRTVSAKLLARQFQAGIALMLVHSFSPQDMWFDQYSKYAALFGIEAEKDMIYSAQPFDGLVLYLGWAKGDQEYLKK